MKIFPSTSVTWLDGSDAPPSVEDGTIERAHVVYAGDRITIRSKDDGGRNVVVDTLSQVDWKSSGKKAVVSGVSTYYTDIIGIPPSDARVTVEISVEKAKCLTC